MEWHLIETESVTFGSVIRWVCNTDDPVQYTYRLYLADDLIVLDKDWQFTTTKRGKYNTEIPDFVEVLELGDELPSGSILRLMQYAIEDTTGDKITTGTRIRD